MVRSSQHTEAAHGNRKVGPIQGSSMGFKRPETSKLRRAVSEVWEPTMNGGLETFLTRGDYFTKFEKDFRHRIILKSHLFDGTRCLVFFFINQRTPSPLRSIKRTRTTRERHLKIKEAQRKNTGAKKKV